MVGDNDNDGEKEKGANNHKVTELSVVLCFATLCSVANFKSN